MARRARSGVNIWPGFVDALTSLVMVVVFVLMVSMFAQQFLSQQLTDDDERQAALEEATRQNETLSALRDQLDFELAEALLTNRTLLAKNSELENADEENRELKNEVQDLTSTEKNLLKQLADANIIVRQLRAENSKLSADVLLQADLIASTETQRAALVNRLRQSGDQTADMEETIQLADQFHQENSKRLITVSEEFLSIISADSPNVEGLEQIAALSVGNVSVPDNPETNLNIVSPERAQRLKRTVESTQALIEAMFEIADRKQRELGSLVTTLETTRIDLDDVSEALLAANLSVANLEEENARVSQDFVDANRALEVNQFTIEANLAEIKILADLREELQGRVNDLQDSIVAFETSIDALRATVSERDQELSETVGTYEERIQALVIQLEAQKNRQDALQAALDAQSDQLDERQLQLDQTLQQLARGESSLESLVAQRSADQASLQQALDRIAELDLEIVQQNEQLSSFRLAVDTSQTQGQDKDRTIAELTARIENADIQNTSTRSQLSTSRAEIDVLNAQLFDLRQKLNSVQAVLRTQSNTLKTQTQELQNADLEIAAALAERLKLEQVLNAALEEREAILARAQSSFAFAAREAADGLDGIVVQEETSTVDEQELTQVRFKSREKIQFQLGSYEIANDSLVQLSLVAEDLVELTSRLPNDLDWVIRIEGHTDQTPVNSTFSGDFRNNVQLGFLRAEAVRQALLSTTRALGSDQLLASSFGDTSPIQDARGLSGAAKAEADQLNRRIEFILAPR